MSSIQQYILKNSFTYDDETFPLVYHDINNFADKHCEEVFKHKRRLAIYGTRGTGKSTAMQALLYYGIINKMVDKPMPINVTVMGTPSVKDTSQLTDLFYRSILRGIFYLIESKKEYNEMKNKKHYINKYAPWIGGRIADTCSLLFPPLILASNIAEKGLNWLVKSYSKIDFNQFLFDKNIDAIQASNMLISRFKKKGFEPIFLIDELDKIIEDKILSDFFDGNQAFFMNEIVVMTLSQTFGESIKDAVVSSVRRFAKVECFSGITSTYDAQQILRNRAFLGISQVVKKENEAKQKTKEIFSDQTINTIVNETRPITHLMLEKTYEAVKKAVDSNSNIVKSEHVVNIKQEMKVPTNLERNILLKLRNKRQSPSEMSISLNKKLSSISRTLSSLLKEGWVTRVGEGKRAYYSITQKGLTLVH